MRKLPTTTVSKAWDNWIKSLQDHSPPALWTIYQCSRAAKAKQKSESHILVSDTQFEAGHNNSDTSLRWQVSDRSRIRTELWLPNPTFQSLNHLVPMHSHPPSGCKSHSVFPRAGTAQELTHILVVALPDFRVRLFYQAVNKTRLEKSRDRRSLPSDRHKHSPIPPAAAQSTLSRILQNLQIQPTKKIYTFHREMQCQDKGEWP